FDISSRRNYYLSNYGSYKLRFRSCNTYTTSADISITTADDNDVIYLLTNWAYTAGTDLVYTITVTNDGPNDAVNVQVTDPISDIPNINIANVTWTGSNGTSGTGDLSDTIAVLENGETVTYTVTVPIPANYS